MVSPAVFDTLAALTLLAVALVGAYAPLFLYKLGSEDGGRPKRSLAYVMGNMLSAGVMISAGFVHLLGAAVQELNPRAVFPLAPFLCGLGFILTLIADHTAELLSARSGWSAVSHSPCGHLSAVPSTSEAEPQERALRSVVVQSAVPGDEEAELSNGQSKEPATPTQPKQAFQVEGSPLQNGHGRVHEVEAGGTTSHRSSRGGRQSDTEPLFTGVHSGSASLAAERGPLNRSISNSSTSRSLEALAATMTAKSSGMKQVSFLTAVLMAVALCFHSILEGMAMGAQESVVDTFHIFIAIFAHKGLAAYALGSSLVDSGAGRRRFWTVIAVFALATPAGIGLGRVIASFAESGAAAGLSALASGTFLYVAFMEVIPKEMEDPENGFSKLAMLCLGFGAMSVLAIWA